MTRAEALRFDLINRLSLVSDTLDRGASRRFIFFSESWKAKCRLTLVFDIFSRYVSRLGNPTCTRYLTVAARHSPFSLSLRCLATFWYNSTSEGVQRGNFRVSIPGRPQLVKYSTASAWSGERHVGEIEV